MAEKMIQSHRLKAVAADCLEIAGALMKLITVLQPQKSVVIIAFASVLDTLLEGLDVPAAANARAALDELVNFMTKAEVIRVYAREEGKQL